MNRSQSFRGDFVSGEGQAAVDTLWRTAPDETSWFWGYYDMGSPFSSIRCGLPELAQKLEVALDAKADAVVFGDPDVETIDNADPSDEPG